MKKQLGIYIIVCFLLMLTACQEQKETPESAPLQNLFGPMELSYNEYKFILEDVVERAKNMHLEDEELEKWVIRALGDEKLTNKRDLTKEEAIQRAESNQEYHHAWIAIAENKYGVNVSEEELDAWIAEGPDKSEVPQHKAYAEALGLTLEELNHEYDRELYKQSVIMDNLLPILEEAYGTSNIEEIAKKFEQEVMEERRN